MFSSFDRLVSAESLGKFFYSREGGKDYLITESYNATQISAETRSFAKTNEIEFRVQNYHNDKYIVLNVDANRFKENESFAVEAFWNETQTSDESLKHLTDWVHGSIIIRKLTAEESSELEAYKQRQQTGERTHTLVFKDQCP